MDYSIQLYSVRDTSEKSLEAALKAVSELGYSAVEFAGFFGHSAEEVKAMLEKYNLKVSGTHSSLDDLINNFDATVEYHKAIGNKNYIIPGYDIWSQEKIDYFVKNVNELEKKLSEHGISLGFHNHSREFEMNEDGSFPYEQIIYRTNIQLEVDTYWAFVGMKNPIALLERIKDRIKFIHIKDGFADKKGMPLGKGEAPVKDVYAWAKENGKLMVVESETLNPDGITEAKICIDYLKQLEN